MMIIIICRMYMHCDDLHIYETSIWISDKNQYSGRSFQVVGSFV